jgi:Subtilase family
MRRVLHVVAGLLLSFPGAIDATPPDPGSIADAGGNAVRQVLVTVSNPHFGPPGRAGTTPKSYVRDQRYTISPVARQRVAQIEARHELVRVAEWPIETLGVHCVVFQITGDESRERVLTRLREDPAVESAQAMQMFATRSSSGRSSSGYDDPYFGLQRGFAAMDVEGAHRRSRGKGVRVAVVDTGVDATHPDLAGRIIEREDLVSSAATRGPQPVEQHGTGVAGVIAATANNGVGIVGIAPAAKLLILRACWQVAGDDGTGALCNSFTLARALARAIEERAAVINLSLSGPLDPLLARLVGRAIERGAIVVGARPESSDEVASFPASVPGVIAVQSAEAPDASGLCAPGRDVLTLRPRDGYEFENGSSLAAAQVAGVVALLIARKRGLTTTQARTLLERSSIPRESAVCMVNACSAVSMLLDAPPCAPPTQTASGVAWIQK